MTYASPLRRALGAALVALTLAGGASAQFKSAKLDQQKRATEQVLTERNRETMHPGGALEVVGVEQGDNEIRSRTPALERSDRAAAQVDVDELRERRLAMYQSGARFHSAPPSSGDSAGEPATNDARRTRTVAPPVIAPEPTTMSWGFACLVVVVVALGILWWKQNAAPPPEYRAMHNGQPQPPSKSTSDSKSRARAA